MTLFHGLVLANFIAFTVYGYDKAKAIKNEARVTEKLLYLLILVAPFGSFLAIKTFRHKTRKSGFIAISWIFMLLWLTYLFTENL